MRGGRRRAPDRFKVAATASAIVHAALLTAVLVWSGRHSAGPAAPERGVEIVWDEASGEAVGEDAATAPPAPEQVETPQPPPAVEAPPQPETETPEPPRPPPPPPLPPPAPPLAEAPPAPMPALDLPPNEARAPDLTAVPMAPPRPEMPPSGESEALPGPPPEPPPPPPPPERSRVARQPAATPSAGAPNAAAPSAAGVGRATGAVVPPGLDPGYRNSAPGYPEASRLRGEQGSVGLDLSIDARGRVVSVTVARSSGSPALDAAARQAVAAWRFRPASVDGRPVPGAIRTTVHFRLD